MYAVPIVFVSPLRVCLTLSVRKVSLSSLRDRLKLRVSPADRSYLYDVRPTWPDLVFWLMSTVPVNDVQVRVPIMECSVDAGSSC